MELLMETDSLRAFLTDFFLGKDERPVLKRGAYFSKHFRMQTRINLNYYLR